MYKASPARIPLMLWALSGWPKSGKDTLAEYLVKEKGFVRISSGDALKEQVARDHGIPLSDLHDVERKDLPILNRPVVVVDSFSQWVADYMKKEFRTKEGKPNSMNGETVYWTPRAIGSFEAFAKRAVDPQYWIGQATKNLEEEKNYVLTDWRFKSEQEYLKEKFGKKVLFIRIERFETCASASPFEHDLDDAQFDAVLNNSEKEKVTTQEFFEQADELLKHQNKA